MTLRKIYIFIKKEFLLAGHLMSLGSGILASLLTIVLLPNSKYNPLIALSIYLFVQPIYWIDRYGSLQKDINDNLERTKHISMYQSIIPFVSFLYISLFSFIATYLDKRSFLIGILGFLLGCLYSSFFKHLTKYIIGFKNYFVAFFYVIFLIYAFIYNKINIYNMSTILIFIFIFIRSINIQIFLDLKDINSDKRDGLKTIPIIMGKLKSIKMINIINILSTIPILYGVLLRHLPFYILIVLGVLFPYAKNTKNFVNKPDTSQFINVASEYLLLSLLVTIGITTILL